MTDTPDTQRESLRIQPADLLSRLKAGEAATIVDVRKPKSWERSLIKLRGAVRIDPAELPLDAAWPEDQLLAFY